MMHLTNIRFDFKNTSEIEIVNLPKLTPKRTRDRMLLKRQSIENFQKRGTIISEKIYQDTQRYLHPNKVSEQSKIFQNQALNQRKNGQISQFREIQFNSFDQSKGVILKSTNYFQWLEQFLKDQQISTELINYAELQQKIKSKSSQGRLERKHLILKLRKTNGNSIQMLQKQKANTSQLSKQIENKLIKYKEPEYMQRNMRIKFIQQCQLFKRNSLS